MSRPVYVAPLPKRVEGFALEHLWVIVAINLVGTAFGFYYYLPQFTLEPLLAWPFVPDSPTATLFVAVSLALYKLDRSLPFVDLLAFVGSIKLGLWTPMMLLTFAEEFSYLHWAMYNFLFWSHLMMVVQAFLIHRYSDFPGTEIVVAAVWYGYNDFLDYFSPIAGLSPHHTLIPAEPVLDGRVIHNAPAHEIATTVALGITLLALGLAVLTRRELRRGDPPG